IRALLMILIYQLFDAKGWKKIVPSACAVELVHLSSLLLDDLPSMDNATLRRGKEVCHRKYGENVAVLAAVGLLNLAYQVIFIENQPYFSEKKIHQISQELSHAVGFSGMIGGQFIDLKQDLQNLNLEQMEYIHSHKTSSLFIGCMRISALLAGAKNQELEAITKYGKNLGLAYQIKDDLLDLKATPEQMGKDANQDIHKFTFVKLCGPEKAFELMQRLTESSIQAISFFGKKADLLVELSRFLVCRTH
ncbi:MAG: polyprenyl synthetase family protein, partial [Planctomycetota bacterium]